MKIGIPLEVSPHENRVAITPEIVKKTVGLGCEVWVQKGAGESAHFSDAAYKDAGANLGTAKQIFACPLVLKVRAPEPKEIKTMASGTAVIGMLSPFNQSNVAVMAKQGLTAFSLEKLPRNTRAQSMDVLSSQANVAGYKSILLANQFYQRLMPMLMTAAGTIKAARVLVLGAGVAGLQAIATAKRLGAVVEASDVRPSVKEQITSLGAKFIDVPYETEEEKNIAAGESGYASAMPAAWMARQAALVAQRAKDADMVITSALIPGRQPPILIDENTVKRMKSGAVIVDLAAGLGKGGAGNCPLTVANEVVTVNGVTIVGYTNLPSLVSTDASSLYARNVFEFMKLLLKEDGTLLLPNDDELVQACMICHQGNVVESS
ncbi:MAG: NAD(P)(+) transhydrogenase (Re/Si-specific) subunit alpha [Methylophilaceae bacterium]|nr:MAG: NAD(P)(+) transhydrogenase (Re/Si-specific) subunit alpha [Methylophilaceae bacterium]